MTTYNTGNPLGSASAKDLYDNAENLDAAVNDTSRDTWSDRLGRSRKTMSGMEREFSASQIDKQNRFNDFIASSGYQFLGDYAAGIEITEYNQIVRDSDGEFWRLSGEVELPYTTTGDWGDEEGLFVAVGDASLRQELAAPGGATLVGQGVMAVGSIADLLALPAGQRREDLRYLVKGYHAGSDVGGGEFYWAAGISENDGVISFNPSDDVSGCFKRIVAGYISPEMAGADPTGVTPSAEAWQKLNNAANESGGFTHIVANGKYLLDDEIGTFLHKTKVTGLGEIIVDSDIPKVAEFNEYAQWDGPVINGNGYCVTDNYVLSFLKPGVFKGNITNFTGKGAATNTQSQYAIHLGTFNGSFLIKQSEFKNINNMGDGLATNFGFCGFVFVEGDALSENERMAVKINGCTFDGTKTMYPPGLTYAEMINDMDADAIRVYINNPDTDHRNRLSIYCNNNIYSNCQKRFYKINNANLYVKDERALGFDVSDDYPGMSAIYQGHQSKIVLNNCSYQCTIRNYGFVNLDSAVLNELNGLTMSVRHNSIDSSNMVRAIADTDHEFSDWHCRDVVTHGVHSFAQASSGGAGMIHVDGLYMTGARRLIRYHFEGAKGIFLNNIHCEFEVPDGDQAFDISLYLQGSNPSAKKTIRNVTLTDIVPRGASSGFPRISRIDTDDVDITGLVINTPDPTSTLSQIQINGANRVKIYQSRLSTLQMLSTVDCVVAYTTYHSLSESGNTGLVKISSEALPV